jgi:RNA polymerase primary sigma factor
MDAFNHSADHEDGLPSYLGRLTQVALLTSEEEITLTRAVKKGDERARQRLIEANMRLVINIAKAYRSKAIAFEDLIQEGAIGLMQAAERFDPEKGFRFSTYATHWIRQSIGRAIDNKSKAIRIPAHVSQTVRKAERERARLSRELGQEPSFDQLCEALDIAPGKLKAILQTSQDLLSLDMNVGENGGTTLGGLIEDPSCAFNAEETLFTHEMMEELQRIMQQLSERERRVMSMRFRLDGTEPPQHDEVAKELKLSRERVRQIELQAIKKLRILAQRHRLRELLGN